MAKRHMKRYSTFILEKSVRGYNEITSHAAQNGHHQKNIKTINVGEGVEKRESSYTVGGSVPGACVRNSARDKVMRKEADIRKVVIRLQELPLAFPEHPPSHSPKK